MYFKPEYLLCTDGAFAYMSDIDIFPDAVIGDLDSLEFTPEDVAVYHIEDQDTTDFEKALDFLVDMQFERVVVLGSTGGQHDHFLGNLNAAYKFRNELNILFFDQTQYFFLTEKDCTFSTEIGKIVSLFPFPECTIKSLSGLKYTLNMETLTLTSRVGTRNITSHKSVKIEVHDGALWVFVAY